MTRVMKSEIRSDILYLPLKIATPPCDRRPYSHQSHADAAHPLPKVRVS
jgi:hypothetical protein